MTKPSRRVLLALTFSLAATCGGTPTAPPPTPTITGTVTTSAPTFAPLVDVTLTVLDGAAAGKSITTNANGEFALSTGQRPLTVRASRDGYESQTLVVDAAGPQTLRFTLKPLPREVGETLTPAMGAACSEPCRRVYALPIHNDGKITASLGWLAVSSPSLSFWRGDTQIPINGFCVGHHTGSTGSCQVTVTGGAVYHLRVEGGSATTPLNFHLTVLRPN